MAQAALRAGARGLWLEKAVATSVASARELRAAAAAAGASVVVNHPRAQDPHYRAVRRLIEDGTLGPLESIHVVFSGHLIHTGTHAWDVLDSWCGPWAEVRTWPDAGPMAGAPSGSRPHADAAASGRAASAAGSTTRRTSADACTSASPTASTPSCRADGRATSSSSSI